MIKVIKMGTRRVCTCCECGCKFSYEAEDIQREDIDNYKAFKEFVQCPQCHEKVIFKQTR